MNANPFMQSLLWCCTSCGFTHQGGQPFLECPICEGYKTGFIDMPQHVEAQVRAQFGELSNSSGARALRLQLLREGKYMRSFQLKGRVTKAVHLPGDSRDYLDVAYQGGMVGSRPPLKT